MHMATLSSRALHALVSWQSSWAEWPPFNVKFPLFRLAAQLQKLVHILKMRAPPRMLGV